MEFFTLNRQDIESQEKQYRTNFINALTGFKSVALLGTQNKNGILNLAIFSQIIHVGANPPLMGVLFRPHTVARHTLENILETNYFTINHILEDFVDKAHHTSARWDISEFEACGLSPEHTPSLPAPYVKEAHVKIGLQLKERVAIATNDTILIVGEIVEVMLPAKALGQDGFVDLEIAGTLTCSGLDTYHKTQKIARFSYAKPDQPLSKK